MQRYLIVFTLLYAILKPASIFAGMPFNYYIQSECRKDSIDYSEIERYFYREKLYLLFSMKSSLNIAYVYIDEEEVKKHTWSLSLKDISPHTSFVFGNYYVNFGYGLLIGRKRLYQPDIFSSRMNPGRKDSFIPCKSGNPDYSFNGIAVSFSEKFMRTEISLKFFYSIKERFIDEDSYNSSITSSSINSIDYKRDKEYNHNEPIDIHTHGGMLSVNAMDLFFFQLYYLFTNLHKMNGDEILWDQEEIDDLDYGTSKLLGSGFFTQYEDDFLSLFVDASMTTREIIKGEDKIENSYGYGLLYGLKFTPPFLKLSLIGKDVDHKYYSPYGSSIGEDYPERAWFFNTEISPYRNLQFGSSISSQKKSGLSSRDKEPPVTQRKKIYIHYSYSFFKKLDLTVRNVKKIKNGVREKKLQFKERARMEISEALKIDLVTIYQQGNNVNLSKIFTSGINLSLLSYFNLALHYLIGYISEDNSVYAIISPIRYSSTPGFFIKENSSMIISKFDFKYKMIFFSCRYLYQFLGEQSLHKRLEFFGSGKF